MSYVVIVKTADDSPLWPGLPSDYPVSCVEFETLEQANAEHPGKTTMTVEKYKEYSAHFHSTFPFPEAETKKSWWKFWGKK